jgi:hypothetical protein
MCRILIASLTWGLWAEVQGRLGGVVANEEGHPLNSSNDTAERLMQTDMKESTALEYTCPPDYTANACEPRGTPNQTAVIIGSGPNCASAPSAAETYFIDCPGGGQIFDYAFSNCGGGSGPESCCNCWSLGEPLTPSPPTPPTPAPPPPEKRCLKWCEKNTVDWYFKCGPGKKPGEKYWNGGACAACIECIFPTNCTEPGQWCEMPKNPCCPGLRCEPAPLEGKDNHTCVDPDAAQPPAPTPPNPAPAPEKRCLRWCTKHPADWDVKCGPGKKPGVKYWNGGACAACEQCTDSDGGYDGRYDGGYDGGYI